MAVTDNCDVPCFHMMISHISVPNPNLSHRKNEFGSWVQSVEYEPRLEDDGKTLSCSLASGSKGATDSITTKMLMNTMEGKSRN